MKFTHSLKFVSLALSSLLVFGALTAAYAQGRGRGVGGGMGGGRGMGEGVGGGIGNASDRSNGRSDTGMGNASDKSNGRSDAGLEHARATSDNKMKEADSEMGQHPGLAKGMNMSANQLREGYQAALAHNPNLKFGQYVAANRIAKNLGDRNPNITSDAILQGLASGKSIGQRLQELGMSSKDAKEAEKEADRQIKESKKEK